MSLDIASRIALSGLTATQVQLSVTSANISNADTTGYTRKTATQSSSVTAGVGTGVTVTAISSTVDKLLLKSLVGATSDLGAAQTTSDYLDQLQQLFGSVSSSDGSSTGSTLANTIADLESALTSLSATPASAALQSNVVSTLDDLASQLRATSSGIQSLRSDADKDIASNVSDVNAQLQAIADLNTAIRKQAAAGQSTADLEDQRNTALQDVASKLNISYFTAANGDLQIYTASGQALVDSTAHTISYSTAATVTADTSYVAGGSGGFSGLVVNGVDITSTVTSGSIGALLTLRDTTLPAAQDQLDALADGLASSLNAAANDGTSVPPPSELTGTASVAAGDTLSATGTVRIAVTDSSGKLSSYQDLDLSQVATVGDLVTALNGITGVSASLDASGHLVVSSTGSSTGIAINGMTSSIGSDAAGFSSYFGLNDLVTGTGASNFAVRADLLSGASGLPTASLDGSASLTAGSTVLSSGSATVVNALDDALTATRSFAAVGGLSASSGSLSDFAATIVADAASKASQASDAATAKENTQSAYASSLSSQSGVNVDEESAKLSTLQNKYSAASELLKVINEMFSSLLSAVQSAG
jgi:flagellar hook-associated protein 1 FlgK